MDKRTRYARIKYSIAIIDMVYFLFLLVFFQSSGASVWLSGQLTEHTAHPGLSVCLYILAVYAAYIVLNLPLSFYRSYTVEHNFGLSKQGLGSWAADFLKAQALGAIFFMILAKGFFFFLRQYPSDWWWMASAFWIALSIIITHIFPVIIIPLFFKYKPVEDDGLRGRIVELSKEMAVRILGVFEIDFSKKSLKANAGLMGLGGSRRIILTDTLRGKYSSDEIEVILAHEFAHHKLRHVMKHTVMGAAITAATFYLFFKFSSPVFRIFNLGMTDIASLGIWIFLLTTVQIFMKPVLNWVSRNMETNADILALKHSQKRDAFISMMRKLGEQNLSEPKPPFLIKVFFYDHPPTEERIELAEKMVEIDHEYIRM